jgi:hypothetical protein
MTISAEVAASECDYLVGAASSHTDTSAQHGLRQSFPLSHNAPNPSGTKRTTPVETAWARSESWLLEPAQRLGSRLSKVPRVLLRVNLGFTRRRLHRAPTAVIGRALALAAGTALIAPFLPATPAWAFVGIKCNDMIAIRMGRRFPPA